MTIFAKEEISNPDVELKNITGSVLKHDETTASIIFSIDDVVLPNYSYNIYENNSIVSSVNYSFFNGQIIIDKTKFSVGSHTLLFAVQTSEGIGEFEYTFENSSTLFIKNIALLCNETYYKNANEIKLLVTLDKIEDIDCQEFTINNIVYTSSRVYVSENTGKTVYEIIIPKTDYNPLANELEFILTNINFGLGDVNESHSCKIQLNDVNFEFSLENDAPRYVDGSSKTTIIRISNINELVTITGIIYNEEFISAENAYIENGMIVFYIKGNVETNEEVFNSIKYEIYGTETEVVINHINSIVVMPIINYVNCTNFIKQGDLFQLVLEFDQEFPENITLEYYGRMDLFTEIDAANTSYEIVENKIIINLDDFFDGVRRYPLNMNVTMIYEDGVRQTLLENEFLELIYSSEVFSIYNFEYDSQSYCLEFDAMIFGENVEIKEISFVLYDEEHQILKDENNISKVTTFTENGVTRYSVSGIPRECHSIQMLSVTYTVNGELKMTTELEFSGLESIITKS